MEAFECHRRIVRAPCTAEHNRTGQDRTEQAALPHLPSPGQASRAPASSLALVVAATAAATAPVKINNKTGACFCSRFCSRFGCSAAAGEEGTTTTAGFPFLFCFKLLPLEGAWLCFAASFFISACLMLPRFACVRACVRENVCDDDESSSSSSPSLRLLLLLLLLFCSCPTRIPEKEREIEWPWLLLLITKSRATKPTASCFLLLLLLLSWDKWLRNNVYIPSLSINRPINRPINRRLALNNNNNNNNCCCCCSSNVFAPFPR